MTLAMKLDEARAEGREKGLLEGRKEGLLEGAAAVARRLVADGVSDDLVCKYTGLSLQEVEELRDTAITEQ